MAQCVIDQVCLSGNDLQGRAASVLWAQGLESLGGSVKERWEVKVTLSNKQKMAILRS